MATASAAPASRTAPSLAVLRTEARLFLREPGSLFWILAFPTVLMTILGLIPSFREHDDAFGGRRVIDLYVPVAVLLAMIMAGLQAMPPVLTGYRERGILRRMSTTPVRPSTLLGAQIALHGGGSRDGGAVDRGGGDLLPPYRGAGGFGLGGMRARAERIAGTVEVETGPGLGTAVCARGPMARQSQDLSAQYGGPLWTGNPRASSP